MDKKFSRFEMGDSRYYSSLKILAYLLNQVFGGTEITVDVFNRDHYSEGMVVDGWIEIIFPKTIDLNSRLKNTIRSMLDLIRESFANHPDFISTFGEANLGRGEGNFITCGLYDDSEPDLEIPYYKEWTTNDHNSAFTIKYSIAVKDKIVGEVNEALVKYDDAVDTATSLEMPRINRLKEDLAALHLTPSEVTEIIGFISTSTNPVYEFDLFSMGQDIYVSAYLAQHGEALGHVFDSTVILNIIKSKMNMSQ